MRIERICGNTDLWNSTGRSTHRNNKVKNKKSSSTKIFLTGIARTNKERSTSEVLPEEAIAERFTKLIEDTGLKIACSYAKDVENVKQQEQNENIVNGKRKKEKNNTWKKTRANNYKVYITLLHILPDVGLFIQPNIYNELAREGVFLNIHILLIVLLFMFS